MKKILNEIVTHPLFSGSTIMVFGSNSINAINYLYHLVMGRLLGPTGYGELAALISLMGLLGVVSAGINLAVTKYVSSAKNDQEANRLSHWLKVKFFQLSVAFSAFILITSPLTSAFLRTNINYIFIIAAAFLFSFSSTLNRAILQGLLKFKEMVISVLFENTSKLLIGSVLVLVGFKLSGAMMGIFIAAIIGWYLTHSFLKGSKSTNPKRPEDLKNIIFFTIPVIIQTVAITSLYTTDLILVKHFFLPFDAGIYASLSTLGKIIFFGASPIASVMFPLVSQRQSRGGSYNKIFSFSLLTTACLSILVVIFYWLFPNLAIKLLYGSAYLQASSLLVFFGVFMALFTLSSFLINFGLSLGKIKIVIFPAAAAIIQATAIWFYHTSLYTVVIISILVNTLLLASLVIYSIFERRSFYGKTISTSDKTYINNSAGI